MLQEKAVSRLGEIGAAQVLASALNVRSGPGTSYRILTVVYRGEWVDILSGDYGSWTRIRTAGGVIGYVASQYLGNHVGP
ncbi:MAG TPA: SH3 domain-containing protein [Archangium sp.]|uniref:SH3 domain-containing protein n=1 Tax=Archangium sp. TaxID=1872627 RepID=UPI002E34E8AF|nr:SH3 domain-containing protein [Archangium sp.]HEX5750074.1 SH3 domain-containing protein [Archangium sp.]